MTKDRRILQRPPNVEPHSAVGGGRQLRGRVLSCIVARQRPRRGPSPCRGDGCATLLTEGTELCRKDDVEGEGATCPAGNWGRAPAHVKAGAPPLRPAPVPPPPPAPRRRTPAPPPVGAAAAECGGRRAPPPPWAPRPYASSAESANVSGTQWRSGRWRRGKNGTFLFLSERRQDAETNRDTCLLGGRSPRFSGRSHLWRRTAPARPGRTWPQTPKRTASPDTASPKTSRTFRSSTPSARKSGRFRASSSAKNEVTHAVVSIGGFVGLGGSDVVLPFDVFRFDGERATIDTLASADQIEGLTVFDPGAFGLSD